MSRNLVIVESPAKARTIEKYLGKDYEVLASYGHVRDLVPKEGAVDTEHDFAMRYDIIDRNAKQVDKIARSLKKLGGFALQCHARYDIVGAACPDSVRHCLSKSGARQGGLP